MPSSLMARLKATQEGSDSTKASTSMGGRGRSNVVTPPPLPSTGTSSLAAAASSRYSKPNHNASTLAAKSSTSSSYVPQFKKNPLNVNATAALPSNEPTNETPAVEAIVANDATASTSATPPPTTAPKKKEKTLIQQLLQQPHKQTPIPPPYYMCSESEAYDRQQHFELSPLECNPDTLKPGGSIPTNNNSSIYNGNESTTPEGRSRRHRPTHNPQYVIKKYRRSAAGGGCEELDQDPRSLNQLEVTVDYLLNHIFACQLPPTVQPSTHQAKDRWGDDLNDDPNEISTWGDDDTPVKQKHQLSQCGQQHSQQTTPTFSLSDTVAFIDDRLRAVQKDLVTLMGTINETVQDRFSPNNKQNQQRTLRKMQAKMIRYNILTSYLLADVPSSKYEVKFGARALRTALTCYLNLCTNLQMNNEGEDDEEKAEEERKPQDEIMAYMALLHSAAVLRAEEMALPQPASTSVEITCSLMEDGGSGWGALLSGTFCTQQQQQCNSSKRGLGCGDELYPRWKWALHLASLAQEGNYQGYLALLESGPAYNKQLADKKDEGDNARFLILAKCCASHSLNLIRLGQVRRYNHAFGKGEKVSSNDLARLLKFEGSSSSGRDAASDFCRDVGLPIVEKDVISDDGKEKKESFVVMKSAPISIKGEEAIRRICKPGRSNDMFVFGSNFVTAGEDDSVIEDSLANQLSTQCGIDNDDDVDDWEDRDGTTMTADSSDAEYASKESADSRGRNDEDEVLIPPGNVLRCLIA